MNEAKGRKKSFWLPMAALAVILGLISSRGLLLDNDPRISPEQLVQRLGKADMPLILDVRTAREYAKGHVPGAMHIYYSDLSKRVAEIAGYKEREVVVYCETGPRARYARWVLHDAGFNQLTQLAGDMRAWRRGKYPQEYPPRPGK